MENQVIEAIVTMDERDLAVVCGHVFRQPAHELVHGLNSFGLCGLILRRPAANLTFEVIAGLAEVAEAGSVYIDAVQFGEHAIHVVIDRSAIGVVEFRQCRIPENSAFNIGHDVEHAADYMVVLTQVIGLRDRDVGIGECGNDAEFPVNGMRRFQ